MLKLPDAGSDVGVIGDRTCPLMWIIPICGDHERWNRNRQGISEKTDTICPSLRDDTYHQEVGSDHILLCEDCETADQWTILVRLCMYSEV